jgi:hypothetical protein
MLNLVIHARGIGACIRRLTSNGAWANWAEGKLRRSEVAYGRCSALHLRTLSFFNISLEPLSFSFCLYTYHLLTRAD